VIQSQEFGVVIDLSAGVLRQAVLFAHSPSLEDTSRISAVEALVVVVVETSVSVIGIGELLESVVQAEFSLEDSQSIAERRALLLRAWLAITDILALVASLAGLLARFAAGFLALVDASRNTRVALLVTEVTADINLNRVRSIAAVAILLFEALAFGLFVADLLHRNAAFVFLANTGAFLDAAAFTFLGNTFIIAFRLLGFADTSSSARFAARFLRSVFGRVRFLGIAFSTLGARIAARSLLRIMLTIVTSLSGSLRSVGLLGSKSSSVLVGNRGGRFVVGVLSSVTDSLRRAFRFASVAILLSVDEVVGTASLVTIDSDVLEQPRVGNVFSVAGLEQVLEELVDRIFGVAWETGGGRSVLNILGSKELSEFGEQGITSVEELIEIVIKITEST